MTTAAWVMFGWATLTAAEVDVSRAVVRLGKNPSPLELKAAAVLVEEVDHRTQLHWRVDAADESAPATIHVGGRKSLSARLEESAVELPARTAAEGFSIRLQIADGKTVVWVVGDDDRGTLYGVGRLLLELRMGKGRARLLGPLNVSSAPVQPMRGHQLGYRPKTNSYDAWDVAMWDQYIRELAIFGCNAIELIPPRSDDDDDSPHFPLPKLEMMTKMSQLCDDYGMDVWIWYPTLDVDSVLPGAFDAAQKDWDLVFRSLPRIDAVFVPSGDPGNMRPRTLMDWMKKQNEILRRRHPKSQSWVSVQSFTQPWFDEMMQILVGEQPDWLAGVVFGPQTRIPLSTLRAQLPKKYPIRRYPDITHSMRCEFPVHEWDPAFAFTEAREVINPRPFDERTIFLAGKDSAVGFITYSEGCNDDVNKFVWSGLGWNPDRDVMDVLRDFSGFFIGDALREDFAQGLAALERNWKGPLLANRGVTTTLLQFQRMEKVATPDVRRNWRFQQALYRAYYDAYIRCRLLRETDQEQRAMDALREAPRTGAEAAIETAEHALEQAWTDPAAADLRARCFELAEALFQSIRMQLSVDRYQAIDVGRGASLDTIDVPLNNRVWLMKRMEDVEELPTEAERLAAIAKLVHWTDPGPGGFYDDLGDPANQPHLVKDWRYDRDPGFLQSSVLGFRYHPEWRRSWATHADALYENKLRMHYDSLDPRAQYVVKVVYGGENFTTKVRLHADGGAVVHPAMLKPTPVRPVEFPIPKEATADGSLTLEWSADPGRGGPGRGPQVAEVWLIRKP